MESADICVFADLGAIPDSHGNRPKFLQDYYYTLGHPWVAVKIHRNLSPKSYSGLTHPEDKLFLIHPLFLLINLLSAYTNPINAIRRH